MVPGLALLLVYFVARAIWRMNWSAIIGRTVFQLLVIKSFLMCRERPTGYHLDAKGLWKITRQD